jgi:fimbrial isopeptide formation D2 family protein/uncharacterized repeat protein (TIGR01451 family)
MSWNFLRKTSPSSTPARNLLLTKLEDRILFDASMDAGVDPSMGDVDSMSTANQPAQAQQDAFVDSLDDDNSNQNEGRAVESVASIMRHELIVVDTSVGDYQQLVDDLLGNEDSNRSIDIVLLDSESDGVEQISEILAGYSGLDALHLVTHGDDAAFQLGNVWVDASNLESVSGQIATWGSALNSTGDILLYGCDLAESDEGREVIDALAALTGTDVAASDDDTGATHRGGDWTLEYQHGSIETTIVFSQDLQANYENVLAVGPDVQFASSSQNVPMGENFQFTTTFNNTGSDTGYGPFVDFIFPVNGVDGNAGADTPDGIDFVGATYLGEALNTIEITFPDDGSGTGTIDHPFAVDNTGSPLQITGTAGDKLVVVELPFGSFTSGQPPVDIVVTATTSNLADLGQGLEIQTRSGFRYGADPLDNPTDPDPSVVSDSGFDVTDPSSAGNRWAERLTITPTLMELTKTYLGPEDEIATGPNHEQQYRIDVDIAAGQTISNLDIIDSLPNNVVVTSIDSVLVNGVAVAYTDNLSSLTFPANSQDLIITPNSAVTGTTSTTDVSVVFSFYVTEFDANVDRVIPINGEDDTTSNPDSRSFNNARAVGDWTPIDSIRDAGGTDNAVADPDSVNPEHILDDKAIAIQKSVQIINNAGGVAGANPGDTLRYTFNFQISDYYTFGDLIIDDIFQDGQRFDFGYDATFDVTDMNGTVIGTFVLRDTLTVDESDINNADDGVETGAADNDGDPNDNNDPADTEGTTVLRFNLSKALVDNGAADGILQGGLTVDGVNRGAATGTITFQTIIQDEYADTFLSGDRSVDQGDVITNNDLSITGSVRQNAEDGSIATTLLPAETDNSSASVTIATGTLVKDVYAINGNTTLPTGPSGKVSLTPGDVVTYRIRYTVPTSDFENLVLSDFLPLPIFDVNDHNADGVTNGADAWSFNLGGSFDGTSPASGVIEFGDNDTFYSSNAPDSNITPTISIGSSNDLQLTFGNYDDPNSASSTIELYFSITAQNEPTADGLFLTNIVRAAEGTTQNQPTVLDEIVQVEVLQPALNITKGIVSSDNAGATFDSTIGPGGITFGTAGTAGPLFTGGTINSDSLASQRINANITGGVDAGDTIRYAIVLENTGNSTRGAYDVQISDSLPAGLSLVAGSLRIVDGTGAAITYSGAEADLFAGGVTLDDPGSTPDTGDGTDAGSVDGYDGTDGRNVVILFYDVTADASVEAAETYTNVATIENFAGQEGGANHAANRPSDDAEVVTENVAVTKTIVSTSESHTGVGTDGVERVTIGEVVRYRIQVALPEGTHTGLMIHDVLPAGLTFIDDNSATVSFISDGVGVTSSTVTAGTLPDDAVSRNQGDNNDNYDTGRDVYFKLGDINNNDRDTNIEYAIVEFNVLVDNNAVNSSSRNDAGDALFNDVRIRTNGVQIYDMPNSDRPQVIVAEPAVQNFDKSGSITSGDAGDTVTYTISFDMGSGDNFADAFNVRLQDALPSDMTFGSLTSVEIDGSAATFTNNSSGNTIDLMFDRIDEGQSVVVVFTATIDGTVMPEQILANTANVTWTSLSGPFGTNESTGGAPTDNTTGSDLTTLDGTDTGDLTYDSTSGAIHGERNGSDGPTGQPNDYSVNATHNVTIEGITTFTKTLVSSEIEDSFNGRNDAVIGELVTYRLTVSFPEGTTPNAVILDTLDNGLAFVGQTSATLNDVSASSGTSPTVSNDGRTVRWDFGTVTDTNLANDTDGSITIEYQAVVMNVSGNQAGTSLDNTAVFSWNNDSDTELTRDAADVTVREPQVDVTKTVQVNPPSGSTTGDAGDPVRYTIVIENTGNYDAFDVTFVDDLPTLTSGASAILSPSFSVVDTLGAGTQLAASDFTLSGNDASGYSLTLNGGVDLDLLKSDGSRTITITIDGTLTSTVGPNQVINNTANAQWTSLDGDVTSRTTFASDDSGERDGVNPADDTHDYDNAGTASLSINPPVFTKSLFSTDQTETSGTDVTIGERVTYALLVNLPEGTTAGVNIVDLIPTGLNYESFQLVTTAAASNGLLTADFNGTIAGGGPTVTGGGPDGQDVTFAFGQIDVTVDNDADNNSFLVLVTAAVSDVATNVGYNPGQTTLTNTATIDIVGDSVTTPQTSNSVDVDVVESNLVVTKNIVQTQADAGDTLTVTLRIDNNGLGNAYEVSIQDILSATDYDRASVNIGTSGTNYPADFTASYTAGTGALVYSGGDIVAGGFVEFTFTVDLSDTVAPTDVISNTATVTNASTLEGTVAGERDDPDPDGDNSDTDSDSVTIRTNSIAGSVYFDADNDGMFDGSETGIGNVTVRLRGTDHLGNLVDTTTTVQTNADGSYRFDNLRPGTYRVTETQPTVALNGKDYLDGTDTLGSEAGGNDSTNDELANIVLSTGVSTDATDYNFGELEEAELSGFVYHDSNNNGVKEASETGIGGVDVTLSGSNDLGPITPITIQTQPDGSYSFDGLRPGEYTITETQPTTAAPSGRDYVDGIDTDGSLANGNVSFNDVNSSVNVAAGDVGADYNFGEVIESVVSGYVYYDSDNDGDRTGETGIEFVTVTLTGTDDLGNVINRSTQTDGSGFYEFANLRPSNGAGYTITQSQPAQYQDGIDSIGTPGGVAGNDVFSSIVVNSDTSGTENNFGETLVDIGDFVWFDADGDGVQDGGEPGLEGVDVTLLYAGADGDFSTTADNITYNTTTTAGGAYSFDEMFNGNYRAAIGGAGLPAGTTPTAETDDASPTIDGTSNFTLASVDRFDIDFGVTGTGTVGDTVFWDQNGNSSQEANEIGLEGIVVELDIDLDGNGTVDHTLSTTTNANGNYLFERVPAGNHVVRVTQPAGTVQTYDSDGLGTSNESTANLPAGGNNLDQDFGYRGTGSIGDTVFFDFGGDGGAFDTGAGDIALSGVQVTLEIDVDGDGTIDLTRTQITGTDGDYLFENLIAGDYTITIDPSTLPAALGNHGSVERDAILNDETDVTLADGENVVDADFGYFATPEYQITKTHDLTGPATPGTTFNYFLEVVNNGDMDGTGVVVTDNLPINVLEATSVTTNDATNVNYNSATGLLEWNVGDLAGLGGTRTLTVTVTVQDPVSVLLDSFENTADVTDDGTRGDDPILTNNRSTVPAPLTAVPDYEIEKTSSLTDPALVGDTFTYTIRVANIGDQDGTGVVVTDDIPIGVIDADSVITDDPANVNYDPASGRLVWNVGDLGGRGESAELTVTVTVRFLVADPLADEIINTATVADDGTNGPEDRLDNNSSTRVDGLVVFAFDSFNDFAQPFDQQHHWRYGADADRELPPLPVDPIFSGLAEPGTTLNLTIYDEEGSVIGQRQVVADSGGNWMANFPNTVIWKHPHRMDVEQTAPIQSDVQRVDGFNMRRYFHPALHHSLFFTERDTVESVLRNTAYETLSSMHDANNEPLQVGWRSHLYQLNVSSTNASAD